VFAKEEEEEAEWVSDFCIMTEGEASTEKNHLNETRRCKVSSVCVSLNF
jgi:hypothetical protein